jgi:hypothetical protein
MEALKREVNASWRAGGLPIHPAADSFPLLPPDELRELGADIEKNGLAVPIVLWRADQTALWCLLDGRDRLDAIEAFTGCQVQVVKEHLRGSNLIEWSIQAGEWIRDNMVMVLDGSVDPYAYVISANIRRRHLNTEEREKILLEFIARTPEKSDRQIAKEIGVDHKTIGRARAKGEDVGRIPHVETRTDTKGRKQRTRKPPNPERAKIYREMKLGTKIMAKIAGTSLDSPRELDALIYLNRGAPTDGHTSEINQLVAQAVAGRRVSAVEWKKNGVPPRDDIDPQSAGEDEGEGSELGNLLRAWDRASQGDREKFKARVGLVAVECPAETTNDGLDIPPYPRRAAAS